jgi:hypothetical protein
MIFLTKGRMYLHQAATWGPLIEQEKAILRWVTFWRHTQLKANHPLYSAPPKGNLQLTIDPPVVW